MLIELFSQLSRLGRYEQILVEIVLLERGVGHFKRKFQGESGVTNEFWRQKTSIPGLSRGVVCMILILRLAVLIQYRRVTHRQTHRHTMMAITRAGKICTDSTVDNNHALHTHEALHGVTAIKFYVKFFCLGFGGPSSALGALGCSPFSPLGNPGLHVFVNIKY